MDVADGSQFDDVVSRIEDLAPGADRTAMAVVLNLIRLSNLMVQDLEATVHRPRGLSWAGFRILFALWAAGPLEPRTLARLSAVTRASVSSVLNTLERDGLVARRRESLDRRVVTVLLTGKGRRAVAAAFREHNAREQEWVASLSPTERRTFAALLQRLLMAHP